MIAGCGNTVYDDKAMRIIDYIRNNLSTVKLSEISKKFGYSPAQMHRILLKYTGNGFSDLVDQFRYNEATRLLRDTDTGIDEIGNIIGLEKTYFYRFFKRLALCTPLQYRKANRQQKITEK